MDRLIFQIIRLMTNTIFKKRINTLKSVLTVTFGLFIGAATAQQNVTITDAVLKDKIKGGWVGQTVGVTYGGPTEFIYNGVIIPDSVDIPWYHGYLAKTMHGVPGLYDDIYVDLTFLEKFYKHGLNVHMDTLAASLAHGAFPLDQANQVARYNYLQGVRWPNIGHWKNNPHADDIDFQIEADFIGLMTPGMPNVTTTLANNVGQIMCYGDGVYGGVYMANMYALAFINNDIVDIVNKGLEGIPSSSEFAQCMRDVIKWHQAYPQDWKRTWRLVENKWNNDLCPNGAHREFNIDAKMNAAYVIMGLLYGGGDIEKTMDISTRSGQDSDCNPSSAAGILGTMLGYSNIPSKWTSEVDDIENTPFMYTDISIKKACDMSYDLAKKNILQNGGKAIGNDFIIATKKAKELKLNDSFPGMTVQMMKELWHRFTDSYTLKFNGDGVVVVGEVKSHDGRIDADYVMEVEVFLNGKFMESFKMPAKNLIRRKDVYWNYNLSRKDNEVTIKVKNPKEGFDLHLISYAVYDKLK